MYCLNSQVSQLKLVSDHNYESESLFSTDNITLPVPTSNLSGHKQKGQYKERLSFTRGKCFPLSKNELYCLQSHQSSYPRLAEERV